MDVTMTGHKLLTQLGHKLHSQSASLETELQRTQQRKTLVGKR